MNRSTFLGVAAIVVVAAPVHAQATYTRDIPAALAAKAKVKESVAAATAQKRFSKGTIKGVELERENGHLQYSYDIATPGKSGVDEVNVDALTGAVIGVSHESAAQVKKEAAEDTSKAKAKPAKPKKP